MQQTIDQTRLADARSAERKPFDLLAVLRRMDSQSRAAIGATAGSGEQIEENQRAIDGFAKLIEAMYKIVRYADSEPDGGDIVAMHRANIERGRAALAAVRGGAQS